YSAAIGSGAWREEGGKRDRLHVSTTTDRAALHVGVSRHHLSDRLRACLDAAQVALRIPLGASIKHMRVAAGELDAVINLSSGELEWDTCAPEIVVREAGGAYTDGDGKPFRYNQRDLEHHRGSVASNGSCHADLITLLGPYLP
ncbi:MAG: hypothetical protein H0T42_19525, partial [Deltaproteobacteria bacterium]|nr:hypothetical protein [Deltaproteobacteria bacterium]